MKKIFFEFIEIAIIWCMVINISIAQDDKSFLSPPMLIKNPLSVEDYSCGSREFTGIPSIAVSNEGRIWAVWYAGKTPGEDANNYIVLSTSEDKGNTWKEVLVIDPDGGGTVRAFDPEIWIDPDGMLWVFWAQTIDHNGTIAGVWALTAIDPNTENPDWSEPRRLTDGVMMCKPIILSSGEWIIPASTWRLTNKSAKVIVSQDKGYTWYEKGAVDVPEDVRNYDEHMIIERKDGSLWMLVRTKYGIGESISVDKGITWGPLVPSKIQHPVARFFISRLNSGNLLLVKHGSIDIQTGRSHLMAFLSKDDGQSWSKGLLLDERKGISYPDGQQAEDGTIYITYDYNRTKEQMILMTSFTEDDILGEDYDARIIKIYNQRKVVSKGGGTNDTK